MAGAGLRAAMGVMGVTWALACATTTASRGTRPAEPPTGLASPRHGESATLALAAPSAVTLEVVLQRPSSCGPRDRWPSKREVLTCGREDRIRVRVLGDGSFTTEELPSAAPRPAYPIELVQQWRTCPFAVDARLAALPAVFAAYEDPDVGPCYLLRPLDPADTRALEKRAHLKMLDGLHPLFADAIRALVVKARSEGIDVKVISGLRAWTERVVWVTKKVKRGRTMTTVKVPRKVHKKTWHQWGLGVDVNLLNRNDLASAVAAFRNDPEERRRWQRIGEIGQALGLKWLGAYDAEEIFHFEWHPSWPGRPDGVHGHLVKLHGGRGNPGVWRGLQFDPARPTVFRDLRDDRDAVSLPHGGG